MKKGDFFFLIEVSYISMRKSFLQNLVVIFILASTLHSGICKSETRIDQDVASSRYSCLDPVPDTSAMYPCITAGRCSDFTLHLLYLQSGRKMRSYLEMFRSTPQSNSLPL